MFKKILFIKSLVFGKKNKKRIEFWTFHLTWNIWNIVNINLRMKYFFWYCLNTTVRKFNKSGNILITLKRFSHYRLLLASSSTFMTDSTYLGTIQICWNLHEHYFNFKYIRIRQIDGNCSSFQLVNMLHFPIRLERLKLIY